MNRKDFPTTFYFLFFILALCSCSSTKYLVNDEELYTGAKVRINTDASINKKSLKNEMNKIINPQPNKKYLGLTPKLWLYNFVEKNPKNGLNKWLQKKGESPVFISMVHPEKTSDLMLGRLNTFGYFNASVKYKNVSKNKKVRVEYMVNVSAPYHINKIFFPSNNDTISIHINAMKRETLIKEGVQYDLDLLKNERERIDGELKDEGFYFFNPDFIIFKADTTVGKRLINLSLSVKPDVPEKAKVPYVLNNIYIFPSYSINKQSISTKADTIKLDGYYYVDGDSVFRRETIIRSVFLKKGAVYSRKEHNLTISRLMGMGVFKFVSIKFKDTLIGKTGILDVFINLTPLPKKSLQVQTELVTKSNNYAGPAITLRFKNRNIFRGAELFVFNTNGSFETQLKQKGLNSYEFGINTQLYIPQFITPFRITSSPSMFVPKTKFDLGFKVLQRVRYFNMDAINFSYGYSWKQNAQKEFEIDPVSLNFAKLRGTTEIFETLLKANPFLRKSFEEQFTIGSKFSFTYNSQVAMKKRNQYYFNSILDLSGNVLYGLQSLGSSMLSQEEGQYKLLGNKYSQYSRISTDSRYYLTLDKDNKIATRLLIGAGIPYGNSSTMPYIKQFFSGGSNSIRAFLPRTLGPGSSLAPENTGQTFLDRSGDIKLEGNLEYRFSIVSFLKGAIFLDAGNVWLVGKNDQFPEGEFRFNKFQKQIAVGTGAGLRVDVSFFVLRLDLGIPLRKPALVENERWVLNKISFGNPSWRKENLVLNIAIGYPF